MQLRRFAVPAGIVTVAILLLVALAFGIDHSGANNSIAYSVQSGHYKTAPENTVELPRLSGDLPAEQTLAKLRGKLVLVNFFASWCVPCQEEAPELKQTEAILKAHGGTVLGISFQQSPSAARSYLTRYGLDYPAVIDPAGDLAGSWGISQVPDSYLINRQGKIVWLNTFQLTPSFISKTLPQLLSQFAA